MTTTKVRRFVVYLRTAFSADGASVQILYHVYMTVYRYLEGTLLASYLLSYEAYIYNIIISLIKSAVPSHKQGFEGFE